MKRNIKFASLVANLVAVVVLATLLIGSTFAWFTDSVTSDNNIIKSGKLDVEMYWADGKKDPEQVEWTDASTGAIFNYDNWEPGYVEVRHIKIENVGTLAFKYRVAFIANGEVSDLSDVIDVYYLDPASKIESRTDLTSDKKIGTLTNVLQGMGETASGNLLAGENHSITIALKMQETAGDEYQNKAIGSDFSIQLIATQLSSESDGFGDDYDAGANFVSVVSTMEAFFTAIDNGDDVLLTEQLLINAEVAEYMQERYSATTFSRANRTQVVDKNIYINGNGSVIYRTADLAGESMFVIEENYGLVLSNITIDGGAVWTGDIDPTLCRGTENSGIVTTANIVFIGKGGSLELQEGAVIQNNDGANAISLTRSTTASSLILNGGEIINNTSAAGAVWCGGTIVINSGKVNYNHATSIGGAFRMLDNNSGNTISFTLNGGEVNHNKSNGSGGAIWSGNNTKYYLNGGEMAYNESITGGGAIWGGLQDVYYITGDFEMHHNVSGDLGDAIRLSHYRWQAVEFEMTGGRIYANGTGNGNCAIYANNNPVVLNGGVIEDIISYNGNDYLTIGNTLISGVVQFNHDGRGDYKILVGDSFAGFKFVVEEDDALFPEFMIDPADGYVYTEGDEAKLICLNEGYETYWHAESSTFRLRAKN